MSKLIYIDNSKPQDENYPNFPAPKNAYNPTDEVIYVNPGEYIINRDGDIMITTTGNTQWKDNTPLADINRHCFRAKYLTKNDDLLICANQSRMALESEIRACRAYKPEPVQYRQEMSGQMVMVF